jgi:hypothetical protein
MSVHTEPITTTASTQQATVDATHQPQASLGERVAAVSGAASVVAAIVGLSIAEIDSLGLDPRSPTSVLVEGYAGHADELRAGAILCAAAAVLAMMFAGTLWARLRTRGEWPAMVAVAGAVTMGLTWLAAAMQQAAFLTFAEYSSGEAARHLLITGWGSWRCLAFPFLGHCCVERSHDRATGDLPVGQVRPASSRPVRLPTHPRGLDPRPVGGARAKILRRRCREMAQCTVPRSLHGAPRHHRSGRSKSNPDAGVLDRRPCRPWFRCAGNRRSVRRLGAVTCG